MDITKIKEALGMEAEATEDDVLEAIKAAGDAIKELARLRAEADVEGDERADLENENAALANELASIADLALDAAVREHRIGETARETWKARLLKDGAAGYDALANEKPLPGTDRAKGLVNEAGQTDSERRMALVNEIMKAESCGYDDAWQRAARRNPELFK